MRQNNGLEIKISKEETRTTITMDLGEIPPLLTRVSLQDPTLHMGTAFPIMEDHMINAQINHFIGTMETDLGTDPSTIRLGTGELMEMFLVLHRPKEETSHKILHIASEEVTNLTVLLSAGRTIDVWVALRLTIKSFHRTIIRHHLKWFASPQPAKPLTKYQTSVP